MLRSCCYYDGDNSAAVLLYQKQTTVLDTVVPVTDDKALVGRPFSLVTQEGAVVLCGVFVAVCWCLAVCRASENDVRRGCCCCCCCYSAEQQLLAAIIQVSLPRCFRLCWLADRLQAAGL